VPDNAGTETTANGLTSYMPTYEGGAKLDFSLSTFFGQSEFDNNDLINDLLIRMSGAYVVANSNSTLSATGWFVGAGFAFLIN
jgi:hypothetical protein